MVVDYVGDYDADIYVRGTNLAASYHLHQSTKSDYRYYVQNAHGDVVNLTDENGGIAKSYTYDAFGVEKNIDDSDANPFRYCGEYFDAETGTIYLRARYYNPTIGRFISRDSYAGKNEDPLSLNLYTYCHNNPIIGIDPSGHAKWNPWDCLPYPGFIHDAVQDKYVNLYKPHIEEEYYIPNSKKRIDLYAKTSKEAWEVKPFGSYDKGVSQLQGYIGLMKGKAIVGKPLVNIEFDYEIFTVKAYNYPNGIILYNFSLDINKVQMAQVVSYLKKYPKVDSSSVLNALADSSLQEDFILESKPNTQTKERHIDIYKDFSKFNDNIDSDLYRFDSNYDYNGYGFGVIPPIVEEWGLLF